jgi:hypothetical protein
MLIFPLKKHWYEKIKQKDGKISYLVIGIDSKGEDNSHILVDKTWIDDDCLCYWEKVEK